MCGIVGIRRFDGQHVEVGDLRQMAAQLVHRGPDGIGFGVYGAVGFGHTRLSIIDLAGSAQPMSSGGGPCHITFNGEIFNYRQVRADLTRRGLEFRTQGDTEVLLETLRLKGIGGLADLNGQFAFGYHDERSGELVLARDRMGILPLYYHQTTGFLAFASEIKALLPVMRSPEIDEDAVEEYLTYGSVPPPRTLFRGVCKLTPGTALHIGRDGLLRHEVYWALPSSAQGGLLEVPAALREVERKLRDAVALRLVADVPVGVCLSGGLDSSLIVALMRELRVDGEVQTFAAGFSDPRYDELPHARRVSEALGTRHHEVMVSADDFRDFWETLTWHRDGPISQPADVAIYKIAKQAHAQVKVLLTGEGSDEIFGGYPKHAFDPIIAPLAKIPARLRVPAFRMAERLLPESRNRVRQAARALTARSGGERMQTWFGPFTWYERRALRPGYGSLRDPGQWQRATGDHLRRMLYVDCHTWLADNLLERADRMSMAAGIESRPPFLDHELVELAFQVPSRMKVHSLSGKWIIKEIARQRLSPNIVYRRKIGFKVPLDEWFRGELKEFMHDLLIGPDSFVSSYFDQRVIRNLLDDHLRRRRNEQHRLWTLLGLEVWHKTCLKGQPIRGEPSLEPARPFHHQYICPA